jgi:hypothetical protein
MPDAYYGSPSASRDFIMHYGIKGMKWGIRKEQPKSNNVRFISGSSKTQDKDSPYYRRRLPKELRKYIRGGIKNRDTFVIGDAPGIDRQTQDYLKKKHYHNVEIYGPGKQVRYLADKRWKSNPINAPEYPEGSPEWLAKKDKAMTDRATHGYAVILDEGSRATKNNIYRLQDQHKPTQIFELKKSQKSLIRGFGNPADQEVLSWLHNDPNKKYENGMNYHGRNYARVFRGTKDRKTRIGHL